MQGGDCPAGNVVRGTSCEVCPDGKVSNQSRSERCEVCPNLRQCFWTFKGAKLPFVCHDYFARGKWNEAHQRKCFEDTWDLVVVARIILLVFVFSIFLCAAAFLPSIAKYFLGAPKSGTRVSDGWTGPANLGPANSEEGGDGCGVKICACTILGCSLLIWAFIATTYGLFPYSFDGSYFAKCDAAAGSYCHQATQQILLCPPGSYCPTGEVVSALVAAQDCPQGSFCPEGSSGPNRCDGGFFCPRTSAAAQKCPAGSYCPAGTDAPLLCSIGSYCPEGTADEGPCPTGSLCPTPSIVTECPAGSFCPSDIMTSITCGDGSYCASGQSVEKDCPAGNFCPTPAEKMTCGVGSFCIARSM